MFESRNYVHLNSQTVAVYSGTEWKVSWSLSVGLLLLLAYRNPIVMSSDQFTVGVKYWLLVLWLKAGQRTEFRLLAVVA